jgi:transcriptional regulator with XRE-family HTH domain
MSEHGGLGPPYPGVERRPPLKRWRHAQGCTTQQTALVLDIREQRILQLEAGESPTDDEMKIITQRTGITKDDWATWERALPRGRAVPPQG